MAEAYDRTPARHEVLPGTCHAAPVDEGARARRVAGVVVAVARRRRVRLPDLPLLSAWGAPEPADVDDDDPWLPGAVHESLLDRSARRRAGAWYTPREVAGLVADWAPGEPLLDPACGGGAFLLAAAEAGVPVDRLAGIDLDPVAAAVAEASLALLGRGRPRIAVGDALDVPWPVEPGAVVGNPPFLGQLRAATSRGRGAGYADAAALFLREAVRRSPRVAMVQPESVLAARDAAAVRDEVAPHLAAVWVPGVPLFDAAVRTCVVIVDRSHHGAPRRLVGMPPVDVGALDPHRWATAAAGDVPEVELEGSPLGSEATVIAGFRDEYYALGPHVQERVGAPLVTSGLIDRGRCLWGSRPARYGGRRWDAPAVADPPPSARRLLVPKVLVATQTRVLEAVADPEGAWVPCTPVISVVPAEGRIWHVLAALLSPAATAWLLRRAAGAALSSGALKPTAPLLRQLPLPTDAARWDAAAAAVRGGDPDVDAYGTGAGEWWDRRSVGRRG